MIGWIFIISVLAVLVFHYMFVGHTNHARPNVDLQIQKYKTIIDKLTQPQPQADVLSHEEDMSYEDLETYVQSKAAF